MRCSKQDVKAIAEVKDLVACHRDGGPSVLEAAMPAIGRLIGSDKWTAYTIDPRGERFRMDQFMIAGAPSTSTRRDFEALVERSPASFTAYDPFRPEPAQQNVAIDVVRWIGWEGLKAFPISRDVFARNGLADCDQLRVLVCEGGTLLAYVGGWRAGEVYTHRERRLLQAIVPALRRALLVERRLRTGPHHDALLEAALEALPPALVLSLTGAVLHANAAGRRLLASGEAPDLSELARGCLPGWELTRVKSAGAPDALLAVRRGEPHRAELVGRAARRYGLTPRQAEVLELLAEGLTYEAMSVRLGCAVKTVEAHVSAVLAKLDASSRADAIARLW